MYLYQKNMFQNRKVAINLISRKNVECVLILVPKVTALIYFTLLILYLESVEDSMYIKRNKDEPVDVQCDKSQR